MSDQPFQISQGYEVLMPRSGKAYPVPCDEWDFLKKKIEEVSLGNDWFNDGGWVLLGIAFSTLGSILLGAYQSTSSLIIAWAIVAVTALSGFLCLFFAWQVKKVKKTQASDIVTQMELIEKRYQSESDG